MIESVHGSRVKALLRAVEDRKLFVVEGEKFILDAAGAGFEFETILHDSGIRQGRLAALTRYRPMSASREVIARFCQAATPQHAVALARRREFSISEVLHVPGPAIYLHAVQDPGNVGAIARVIEAAGASGLLCSEETADAFHPRALRGSAGSLLRIPVATKADFEETLHRCRETRREVCGAVSAGGEDLRKAKFDLRTLWVFGSEGPGLPARIENQLARRVTVPMKQPVESLNVAVAAGIILYQITAP